MTFKIQLVYAQTCPKKLGPILKDIIATWLIAQSDPSPDVKDLSMKSFEAAFPNKLEKVLNFSKSELIESISNNIIKQTAKSMSDSRYTTLEEAQDKYNRIFSGSLEILSLIIKSLPEFQPENYNVILDSKSFWLNAQSDSPIIRTSIYKFIQFCCTKCPILFQNRLELISTIFLTKAFEERSPSCHAEMWGAVLSLVKNYPASWELASEKTPLFSSLFNFYKEVISSGGSLRVSFTCLLPLIGSLPNNILFSNDNMILKDLLSEFWSSCLKIKGDEQNTKIFLSTYYECWLYISIKSFQLNEDVQISIQENYFVPLFSVIQSSTVKLSLDCTLKESVNYMIKFLNNSCMTEKISNSFKNLFVLKAVESAQIGVLDDDASSFSHKERCRRLGILIVVLSKMKDNALFISYIVEEILQFVFKQISESETPSVGDIIILDTIFSNHHFLFTNHKSLSYIFSFLHEKLLDYISKETISTEVILLIIHALSAACSPAVNPLKSECQENAKLLWNSLILKVETYDFGSTLTFYNVIFSEVNLCC